MDEERERAALVELLATKGLGGFASHLRPARARPHARVWTTELLTHAGDAVVEVLAFPFGNDPDAFTAFEDERATLGELAAAGEVSPRDPRLVLEASSDVLGAIVVAAAEDVVLVRRATGLDPPDEDELGLTYHPQLDRVFGGDYLREMSGRPVQSCLMAAYRAERLYRTLMALDAAYRETTALGAEADVPFPVPLAVIELAEAPALARAPAEYGRLAYVHSLIPSGAPVDDRADAAALARTLFTTLACGHRRAGIVFSRAAGCCLRPEFVTAAGELLDAYFVTSANELSPAQLRAARVLDAVNGLDVLYRVAGPAAAAAFAAAVDAYALGAPPPAALRALAAEIATGPHERLPVLAEALVGAP